MRNGTSVFVALGVLLLGSAAYAQQDQTNPNPTSQKVASEDSQEPRLVHRAAPVFPQEARDKRIQGTLAIEVLVDKQGNVIKARVVQGPKIFWEAALTAVKAWKFKPATLQGQPVEKGTTVKMNFLL